MLNKVEIDILQHLLDEGLIDQMNSRTIRRISDKIELNYFRIRTNINHLLLLGLINMGYKERQSKTFYINKNGINELKLQKNNPQ